MPTRVYLPFPPSLNCITAVYKGRKIKSKRGREFFEDAARIIKMQSPKRVAGYFRFEMLFVPPTKALRDVDNYVKPALDALVQNGVVDDDSMCVTYKATKSEKPEHGSEIPGVYIKIYATEPIKACEAVASFRKGR